MLRLLTRILALTLLELIDVFLALFVCWFVARSVALFKPTTGSAQYAFDAGYTYTTDQGVDGIASFEINQGNMARGPH